MRRSKLLLAFLTLLLVSPVAQALELSDMALRDNGQLLRLVTGTYGELFPGSNNHGAETPVVALEIHNGDAEPGRLLVAGTADEATETHPYLLYDARLDAAVLLWRVDMGEGLFEIAFTTVRVSEDGLVWSDVYQLEQDGQPVALAGNLRMARTSDTYRLELLEDEELGELEAVETRQNTVHLFWHQDGAVRYSALSFLEGIYVGHHSLFDWSERFLAAPEGMEEVSTLPEALEGFLNVRSGRDDSTLLVSFANASSGRFGTLALRAVPLRLSALADSVRREILLAADLYDPQDLSAFGDKVGASIVIIGQQYNLHPAIVEYLGRQMDQFLDVSGADYGYSDFTGLVDDAYRLTIDLTSSVFASTGHDPFSTESSVMELQLGDFLDELEDTATVQYFEVEERANLAPPEVGEAPRVFSSVTGGDLLVAWMEAATEESPATLSYRDSLSGNEWSPVKTLALDGVDEALGWRLLAEKIR